MVMFENLKRDSLVTINVYGDFTPSQTATDVWVGTFFWATFFTVYSLVRHRKEATNPIRSAFLFLGAPILSFAGYTLRIPSVIDTSSNGFYLANMIIIGIAPLCLAIATWIVFPALVVYAGPQFSMWKPWVIALQVVILVCSCAQLQIRGLVMAYNYSGDEKTVGAALMLGGLGLALGMTLLYAFLFAVFARRYFRKHSFHTPSRVRTICIALIINYITFLIRTVYRIVEFSLLARYGTQISDTYLYIFDALPTYVGLMWFTCVAPYDLPYGLLFKGIRKRNCRGGLCSNDGARGPWGEEVLGDEASSVDEGQVA